MEPFVKVVISINAPKNKVWNTLVDPEKTAKYMFGCRPVTDWLPGSTLDWVGIADGKNVTYVTGKVVRFEPDEALVYTVIDPNATYPLTPENHLTVTCMLDEVNGATVLTVTQGDYTKVADGEKRYGHGNGWHQLGAAIKAMSEE